MKRRLTAALLCLCLLGTLFPATALAQGETDSGPPPAESALCEHHPQHDENCGYTAGSAGASCTHAHGQACYAPVTNCVHTHTADCYPAESAPRTPPPRRSRLRRSPRPAPMCAVRRAGVSPKS